MEVDARGAEEPLEETELVSSNVDGFGISHDELATLNEVHDLELNFNCT